MRKVVGTGCIVLGLACLIAAIGLLVYNSNEVKNGAKNSQMLLQNLQENMQNTGTYETVMPENTPDETLPEEAFESAYRQMQAVPAGNYESIGILTIPVLELELPVLTDWTYEKLKSAPCHYYGSCYETDFVIAAHNYPTHFGRLSQLQTGDLVIFTDTTGTVHAYEVVLLETLSATAIEEMITSGFDLSLYTCTPGGASRVTVRCSKVNLS